MAMKWRWLGQADLAGDHRSLRLENPDGRAGRPLGCSLDWFQNASAAVLKIMPKKRRACRPGELAPSVRIMSAGQSIEILKGMGLPQEISQRFGLASMKGSHIIGHTRMATESA
jgi:hypothetical protein